jgi:DNA-binding MarR family transcriptional regulator
MTSRLDRLSTRKFVTRHHDPADGRLVQVRLTPTGGRRIDAAFSALLDTERDLLAALPDAKRSELVDALRDLLQAASTGTAT